MSAIESSKSKKDPRKGMSIQLEQELAEPLKNFGKKARMSGADVSRSILTFVLPRLLRGEMEIVNGELRSTSQAA